MVAKLKAPDGDRLNPSYADNPNADRKRQAEAFESLLPAKLRELGYIIAEHGTVTRVTGATLLDQRTERMAGAPSAFTECDVIEITLSGK
jgi:hypothetical protein